MMGGEGCKAILDWQEGGKAFHKAVHREGVSSLRYISRVVVMIMVNWMEKSHLFKRQQEVDEKLVTGLHRTPIL